MTETEIAQQLAATIQVPEPTVAQTTEPAAPVSTNQVLNATPYDLDEMVQYKMHDFFGEQYQSTNEVSKQEVQFIYEQIANMLEDKSYGFVVAKIRDLEQVIGISQAQDRKHRLYQWLKLDSIRKKVDAEMGAISRG